MTKSAVSAAEILDKFRTVFDIIKLKVFRKRRKFSVQREVFRIRSMLLFSNIGTDIMWILEICYSEEGLCGLGTFCFQPADRFLCCINIKEGFIIKLDSRIGTFFWNFIRRNYLESF